MHIKVTGLQVIQMYFLVIRLPVIRIYIQVTGLPLLRFEFQVPAFSPTAERSDADGFSLNSYIEICKQALKTLPSYKEARFLEYSPNFNLLVTLCIIFNYIQCPEFLHQSQ